MSAARPCAPARTDEQSEDDAPTAAGGSVTPGWLAQITTVLVGAPPEAGARLAEEAARRADGEVPLVVLHDWFATSVTPLLVERSEGAAEDAVHLKEMQVLHRRAARGESVVADAWRTALEPVLRRVFQDAYDVTQASATAHAAASSFALGRGYSEADADEYGRSYAEMNTRANVTAHAEANSLALAELLSRAFAHEDAAGYARTYPGAYTKACIHAYAADDEGRERARVALADGLARSLTRARTA